MTANVVTIPPGGAGEQRPRSRGTKPAQESVTASQSGQGQPLDLYAPPLWPHAVHGAELLDALTKAVKRYVVMEAGCPEAVALWVIHAHALAATSISPRLSITSPERGCGKTTCLDLIERLVPRPLPTSNVTSAAVFRSIEAAGPTLLIDEADTFIKGNDELRGILNSGYRRSGAYVVRVVGDDHEPRRFSTWAATVIAMIGKLPSTLADRSIGIRLRRRRHDEEITPLSADKTKEQETLARKAARWVKDNLERLRDAEPTMPSGIFNRTADNWRPLLAIADAAGGAWPEIARAAAQTLSRAKVAEGDQSLGVALLADIRDAFIAAEKDRLPSQDVVNALTNPETSQWREVRSGGRPITSPTMAQMLAEFQIRPINMRVMVKIQGKPQERVRKGYLRADFEDLWQRYLPPLAPPPD